MPHLPGDRGCLHPCAGHTRTRAQALLVTYTCALAVAGTPRAGLATDYVRVICPRQCPCPPLSNSTEKVLGDVRSENRTGVSHSERRGQCHLKRQPAPGWEPRRVSQDSSTPWVCGPFSHTQAVGMETLEHRCRPLLSQSCSCLPVPEPGATTGSAKEPFRGRRLRGHSEQGPKEPLSGLPRDFLPFLKSRKLLDRST